MKNPGLRLAIFIAAIYSILAGFISAVTFDAATLPGSTLITVSDGAPLAHGNLPEVLQALADDSQSIVIREVRDLQDVNARNYYMAVGNNELPEAQWLKTGYPGFNQDIDSQFFPVSQIDFQDPRGTYFIYGPSSAPDAVAQEFTSMNYEAQLSSVTVSAVLLGLLFESLGPSTLALLLLLVLLAATSVMTRAKEYAILRLHGARRRTALARDWRMSCRMMISSTLVLAGASLAALWGYNRLHGIGLMVQGSAITFGVLVALILATQALALGVLWNAPLVHCIKGKLSFTAAAPLAYAIRVPGLLLSVFLVASCFAAASAVQEAENAYMDSRLAGDAATMVFEGRKSAGEYDELIQSSGAWLRSQDTAGEVLLAAVQTVHANDAGNGQQVLVVNNSYLERNTVLDPQGQRIAQVIAGHFKVLVPEGQQVQPDRLRALVSQISAGLPNGADLRTESIAPDQKHYLYRPFPDNSGHLPAWSTNPMIIVADAQSGLISDEDYMALASQGQILFLDPNRAINQTPKEFLGTWISAYLPVAHQSAEHYAQAKSAFRIAAGSAIVSLAVLLATALAVAQIHVRSNGQSILVRHLNGWSFASTHRWLLRTEAVLLGCVAVVALGTAIANWFSTADASGPLPAHSSSLAIAVWQPLSLLLVGTMNLGLLIILLQYRSRAMIRTHSEETA